MNASEQAPPPALILAPIRGITDAVYRRVWAGCFSGFDRAVAPFVQVRQGHGLRPGELRQLSSAYNTTLKTIPQLLTTHPPTFTAILRELHDLGHTEVNWNLGCPAPMVAGRGRGAGLLPHPDRIAAILDQVLPSSPVRLSVKMRLGNQNADEFPAVIAVLNRYPLCEVILHARTAAQMYGGVVDLARAEQAAALCRHPFIYNGDIATPGGLHELRRRFPAAAGWMLGRGALANPFLPAQLKGTPLPDADTRRRQLRQFHDRLQNSYAAWLSGPGHLQDKLLEQWSYLAHAFAEPRHLLTRLRHSQDLDAYADTVAWIFDQPLASQSG
jgi:tRNA-dihydrouridine synthase